MRWLEAHVDEIRRDPVLRAYGAGLALAQLLSCLWLFSFSAPDLLSQTQTAICWPFFESCFLHRVSEQLATVFIVSVGLFALAAAAAFVRRHVALACALLLVNELLVLAIVAQDFRLRLNEHYMLAFIVFAFSFVRGKRSALRIQIVLFYFFAGLLKLDGDWLSGAVFPNPPAIFSGATLRAACAYVVVLELVFVFGLFSRRRFLFWPVVLQLGMFHIYSWHIVGFFYPLLMFLLGSIVVLDRLWPRERQRPRFETWVFLGLFSTLQLVPWLFPGDTAITGEGRLFALHMFDARVHCEARADITMDGQTVKQINLVSRLPPRINCDPIVYLNRARGLCRNLEVSGRIGVDLDLQLASRRSTQTELRPVIALENFCTRELEYEMFRPNDWILR